MAAHFNYPILVAQLQAVDLVAAQHQVLAQLLVAF